MSPTLIELDGSFGEGGGQILRTSLALSLITGRAFHLRNVRAGRQKPGLQPQHLMSVRAAAAIGQAQLRGASRGSTDLVFEPGPVTPGRRGTTAVMTPQSARIDTQRSARACWVRLKRDTSFGEASSRT